MPSIFSRIIIGEIPCHKIAEDENFLAFLDIAPLADGHLLVVPKKEVDLIFDLDEATYLGLWAFARKIAKPLAEAIPCRRVCVLVIGDEVPHAHIHLIPMNTLADVNMKAPKLSRTPAQLAETAQKIREAIIF